MFAVEICKEDITRYPLPNEWKVGVGREYLTAMVEPPDGYKRAFFLKLPPGASIHRHTDAGDCESEHIVIKTNAKALNWWTDATGEHSQHMKAGVRYRVNRTLEHWATNDGKTDRIHLILEK